MNDLDIYQHTVVGMSGNPYVECPDVALESAPYAGSV